VLPTDGSTAQQVLPADCVRAVGFDDEHALLPVTLTGFAGYRLLQEYFAFPQRFLFFDLAGLGPALRAWAALEWKSCCCSAAANRACSRPWTRSRWH
jgi:type VI secretion system protein ImpG